MDLGMVFEVLYPTIGNYKLILKFGAILLPSCLSCACLCVASMLQLPGSSDCVPSIPCVPGAIEDNRERKAHLQD
jgi:hypothetical protein